MTPDLTDGHFDEAREIIDRYRRVLIGQPPGDAIGRDEDRCKAWLARDDEERASGGWHPMETAPRDGSSFLVWAVTGGFGAVVYRHGIAHWSGDRRTGFFSVSDGSVRGGTPIRWMPLPPSGPRT